MEEARRSSPARMKAELVRPGWVGRKYSRYAQRRKGDIRKEGDKIDLCRARMKVALLRPGWYEEVIQKDDQ